MIDMDHIGRTTTLFSNVAKADPGQYIQYKDMISVWHICSFIFQLETMKMLL